MTYEKNIGIEHNRSISLVESDDEEIDILRLVRKIGKKWFSVLLTGILTAVLAAGIALAVSGVSNSSELISRESYTSTVQLLIISKYESAESQTGANYLTTNAEAIPTPTRLTQIYSTLLCSDGVLNRIYNSLNLSDHLTIDQLSNSISISVDNKNSIVIVSATADSAELSDSICSQFVEEAKYLHENYINSGNVFLQKFDRAASNPISGKIVSIGKYAIIGFVVGAFLMVGILAVYYIVSNHISDEEDISSVGTVNLLGSIPLSKTDSVSLPFSSKKIRSSNLKKAVHNKTLSAQVSDSFCELLCNLELQSCIAENKSVVFSSDKDDVVKSYTALYTAITAAKNGNRVLLIDTDFTQDKLSSALGVSSKCGFSNVLAGISDISSAVVRIADKNIDFIPSGRYPSNLYEMLYTGKHLPVLQQASENYDMIVINGSHIGGTSSDALLLANCSAGVVLIATREETKINDFSSACRKVLSTDVPLLGAVFVQ